jgi:hypothetical protein
VAGSAGQGSRRGNATPQSAPDCQGHVDPVACNPHAMRLPGAVQRRSAPAICRAPPAAMHWQGLPSPLRAAGSPGPTPSPDPQARQSCLHAALGAHRHHHAPAWRQLVNELLGQAPRSSTDMDGIVGSLSRPPLAPVAHHKLQVAWRGAQRCRAGRGAQRSGGQAGRQAGRQRHCQYCSCCRTAGPTHQLVSIPTHPSSLPSPTKRKTTTTAPAASAATSVGWLLTLPHELHQGGVP